MALAPIVIFCYNRIYHLKKVVDSLLANEEAINSDLIIYSDGAKQADDEEAVKQVRKYIHQISGFSNVEIIEQSHNLGLAKSVITGVTKVLNQYNKIIVVEDDMVVAPFFLRFMNDALDRYQNNDEVACICGYLYPVKRQLPDTFFVYGADCGAWATWHNQWLLFETSGKKILDVIFAKRSAWRFDFDGSYPYVRMLEDQIAEKNDSWAIRWYGSAFIKNKLTLYPGKSLAQDIGRDNSGTHCVDDNSHHTELYMQRIPVHEITIAHSKAAYLAFKEFFLSLNFNNWSYFKQQRRRFKRWIKYLITNR